MQLRFHWTARSGRLEAWCDVVDAGPFGTDLQGLLTDDGGGPAEHLLQWMKVGSERVRAVLEGQVEEARFDTEIWSSRFTRDRIEIAYHPDLLGTADVFAGPLPTFARVLADWIEFLEATVHDPDRLQSERIVRYD